MATVRLALAFLGAVLCVAYGSLAHDLGSGKRMGFAPGQSEIEKRLAQLIPAGIDQSAQTDLRGVIDRAKMWPQNHQLVVCFLSGSKKARARIAAIAVEWSNYVNLQFDFGDMSSPRNCSGNASEQIKIGFLRGDGYWSYIGIDSWQFPHSMNL